MSASSNVSTGVINDFAGQATPDGRLPNAFKGVVTTSKDQHYSSTVVHSIVQSQEEFQQWIVGLS